MPQLIIMNPVQLTTCIPMWLMLVISVLAIQLRKSPTYCIKHKDIPDGVINNSQETGSNPVILSEFVVK